MAKAIRDVSDLDSDQRDTARRWSIFNAWGWPPDLPKPETEQARGAIAKAEMQQAVRTIGITRCLAYWNSEEFQQGAHTVREFWSL